MQRKNWRDFMCKYCKVPYGKSIVIQNTPFNNEAQIFQLKNDTPGIALLTGGIAQGYFDIDYCPMCGRN
jgi:hypothetical protein